jgi:PhnB protein
MTRLETYLFFDGTCAEAMRFYERALGGQLRMVPASEAPGADQLPPGAADRIMHAHLEAAGAVIMAGDWMAPSPYPGMSGFSVCLTVATTGEAKGFFDKLADGGNVTVPFAKTFYADGFGMLVDRFGTSWMVMTEVNSGSGGTST